MTGIYYTHDTLLLLSKKELQLSRVPLANATDISLTENRKLSIAPYVKQGEDELCRQQGVTSVRTLFCNVAESFKVPFKLKNTEMEG